MTAEQLLTQSVVCTRTIDAQLTQSVCLHREPLLEDDYLEACLDGMVADPGPMLTLHLETAGLLVLTAPFNGRPTAGIAYNGFPKHGTGKQWMLKVHKDDCSELAALAKVCFPLTPVAVWTQVLSADHR